MPSNQMIVVGVTIAAALSLIPTRASPQDPPFVSSSDWAEQAASRREVVERYVNSSVEGWRWFAEASHGETAGAPYVFLKLLPLLAPDIWGVPSDNFARFGFFDAPNSFYRDRSLRPRPLPLGMGWVTDPISAPSGNGEKPRIHFVTLTCAACHVGRVNTAAGFEFLVGAPNAEVDVRKYRAAFEESVNRLLSEKQLPETIKRVSDLIVQVKSEKGDTAFFGSWYGIDSTREAAELDQYLDKAKCSEILSTFAARVRSGREAVRKQLTTSYSLPTAPPLDGGSPGQSDGTGDLLPKLLLFREARPEVFGYVLAPDKAHLNPIERFRLMSYDELPIECATATDSMSVWMQIDRTSGQFDGSVVSPFVRQIAAMTAVVGSSQGVNTKNADITTQFLHRLPSPPYPFNVDLQRARRGSVIYREHCLDCHHARNDRVYSREEIGTDWNRARVISTPSGQKLLVDAFLATFTADTTAVNPETGLVYAPKSLTVEQIISDRSKPSQQGYIAEPLSGIWAKSPYLHNGSVPTLRHLLAPQNDDSVRPAVFIRGNSGFDSSSVGFLWNVQDAAVLQTGGATTSRFDTHWDGASNQGHDAKSVVIAGKSYRLNWSGTEHRDELEDLLEYLKTL